jgi:glycosyltransferase involved in cell wall biosynthesis
MTAAPLVSVLMPVLDAEPFLEEAIESILGQSFGDFELLALDDGSTDASPRMLEAFAARDARVRVLHGEHGGLARRLNQGIEQARGELVARMDADDVAHPERFARQVEYLRAHPECVAVGTDTLEVDSERWPIRTLGVMAAHEEIDARLLEGDGGALVHASAMYRGEALRALGGYRVELEAGEDVDLHLRLAERGRLANLTEVLLEYRKNPAGVTLTRRHQMRRAQDAAIRDALTRRGRDPASAPRRPPVSDGDPPHRLWALWAGRAIEAGHLATARKHAGRALRAAPLALAYWKLMIRAWLGIRPFLWARWREALGRPTGRSAPPRYPLRS